MASVGLWPSFGQRNWARRPHCKNLGTINCTIGLIMLDIK